MFLNIVLYISFCLGSVFGLSYLLGGNLHKFSKKSDAEAEDE